ncbi:MAG: 4-alpha-glucanotransferase [Sedimentitalea sp.]
MSNPDAQLADLAAAHGVHADFHDLNGVHRPTSPDTLRALLGALGVDAFSHASVAEELERDTARRAARVLAPEYVLDAGQGRSLPLGKPCDWALLDETGTLLHDGKSTDTLSLPALDIGYYALKLALKEGKQVTRLLVRPARAPDVTAQTGHPQCWGVTAALYGLNSASNGGLGNYADLAQAGAALGGVGAQFLGVNPINALGWAADDMISPYSPTHRGFFNIDHIALDRSLDQAPGDLIDYPSFRARHRDGLEREHRAFLAAPDPAFFDWQAAQGRPLEEFAQFEALSEVHGRDFRRWPQALQCPGAGAKRAAGQRAAFHGWLQWRAELQVSQAQKSAKNAGMTLGLYLDLAVGPRLDGAEVWMNGATIAKGVSIGAPPDHLSPQGQSWTLAAHAPGPLAEVFYAPLRAMLRKLMAHSGLLRIDHALGLLRSFWLPEDGSPGGYISQPFASLLAVIAIEAHRAGCVIVGEDLGLVPDGFRAQLNAAGLYSYSVWQYEAEASGALRAPAGLSPHSLACFGTHDTPSLQGFWYGEDIAWWQQVGWVSDAGAQTRHAERARQRNSLRARCGIAPLARPSEVSHAVHHHLGRAPCALLAVQLDDALGVLEAQNLPGTIDEHPNWRRRCPVQVKDLGTHPGFETLQDAMAHRTPSAAKDQSSIT